MNVDKLEETKENSIFSIIDDLSAIHMPIQMKKKPLIVLDAQNIAMRHGVDT